jgi:aspartyl-tRNA(Asn)/glutamyl-tRNA(Gln) amidotransferase subunit C
MEVTQQDVIYCAKLANISLSIDGIELLRQDMTKILNHAKNLDQLDLDLIEPYTHSLCIELPRRDDKTNSDSLTKAEALANAPQADGNFFIVPKVM